MKHLLLCALCTTIVAAFQGHLAAIAVSEDVPVPAGTEAVARALGIDTVPERGRFVAELTRLVSAASRNKNVALAEVLARLRQEPATQLVPVPLTAALWSDAVFHRPVSPADLLFAILSDRQAALVCHGLAALDDETLEYFATHTAVLTRLYERHATVFAIFAGHLHIRGEHIIPPGGDAAVPLWERVVGEPVAQADRFVVELFSRAGGRTAYLYDTVGQLDPARRAFALGLWMKDAAARLDAVKTLSTAWIGSLSEWDLKTHPLARQPYDPAAMLMRVRVDPAGAPAFPNSRALWSRAFESAALPDDPARLLRTAGDARPIDAAWLVQAADGDAGERLDRLDQVAFGQRAFGSAAETDMPDVLLAVRVFPRNRMLMLTLERMGVTHARTYASAARLANRLASADRARDGAAIVQLQGVLALLQRMVMVGTIDTAQAESFLDDLAGVPLNAEGRYAGALARWLNQKLRQMLAPGDTFEAVLMAALSGPSGHAAAPGIRWEGQQYRLDLAAAERRRLEGVRERQGGVSIDVALEVADLVRQLASTTVTLTEIESVARRLKVVASAFPSMAEYMDGAASGPGVKRPKTPRDAINLTISELARIGATRELGRLRQSVSALGETADELATGALTSLAYAINLGESDGAALLAGDVSRRHDFGFDARDDKLRLRAPWALPRRVIAPGVPWHVEGSLLGLDVALAPLGLHQLRADRALEEPTLTLDEREAFAASYALMDPFALDDATRDGIAAAIEAGQHRVSALRTVPGMFDALGEAIGMDGWRRRAVRWMLAHESERVDSMFSLSELVILGDPERALNLHAWGMSAISTSGCLCTEMLPPGRWRLLAGRGQLAAATADLNLHVARTLTELGLPARLAKSVLRVAVQDFVDEVRPTDSDDWLTLVRAAQAVPRERIEDDLAAATADGPLVPEKSR